MAEISDQELQVLNGSRQLMDQLLKNPKTKREAEKLIKTIHPETVISEDYEAPTLNRIGELEKKIDDYFKSESDRRVDRKLEEGFAALRRSGFQDEGIEEVKKVMVERQIPDPLDAAAVWERRNPPKPQEPSSIAPTSWGFGSKTSDSDVRALFEDEDGWAERMAVKTWNEVKRGQIITD